MLTFLCLIIIWRFCFKSITAETHVQEELNTAETHVQEEFCEAILCKSNSHIIYNVNLYPTSKTLERKKCILFQRTSLVWRSPVSSCSASFNSSAIFSNCFFSSKSFCFSAYFKNINES